MDKVCVDKMNRRNKSLQNMESPNVNMTKYDTVSFPKDVLDYIDQLRNHPMVWRKYFFSSRAEFIRTAISMFIDKIETDLRLDQERLKETVPIKTVPVEEDHPEAP